MNFLVDLLTGRLGQEVAAAERRGMPRPGEPRGFFARLTHEQEAALLNARLDDAVGDPERPDLVREPSARIRA